MKNVLSDVSSRQLKDITALRDHVHDVYATFYFYGVVHTAVYTLFGDFGRREGELSSCRRYKIKLIESNPFSIEANAYLFKKEIKRQLITIRFNIFAVKDIRSIGVDTVAADVYTPTFRMIHSCRAMRTRRNSLPIHGARAPADRRCGASARRRNVAVAERNDYGDRRA
ncbi:hypothetical protein EVAR_53674_1 [Eumeta japonica]|uniref:Uncharacterized protein n=1 Tax=Eumeta variegata TaxID=151549 RepID=A0A4C1YQX9_EUMVA|nr:hypothetical protein EVAR_53674_1 [Eumeta japonica]